MARASSIPSPRMMSKARQQRAEVAATENVELYRTKALWFVDLFPDELIIQSKTISVIRHQPFISSTETLPIQDVGRVVYVDTPFFGGLQILGKNPSHDLHIKALRKRDAQKAKDILEKLLLAGKEQVEMPIWLQGDKRLDDQTKPEVPVPDHIATDRQHLT